MTRFRVNFELILLALRPRNWDEWFDIRVRRPFGELSWRRLWSRKVKKREYLAE